MDTALHRNHITLDRGIVTQFGTRNCVATVVASALLLTVPWQRLSWPGGGEATPAAWPAGVPRGLGGPRAQAVGSPCPGAYRLSKRTPQRLLAALVGLQGRVGTLRQLEATTTEAGAAPVEEARRCVQEQARAHLDETGWREGGQRAGGWVAATRGVTVLVVRLSRGGTGRAPCGARPAAPGAADVALVASRPRWHAQPVERPSSMSPGRRAVERRREAGSPCGVPKTEGMCRAILQLRQALWTFVPLPGVAPTHHTAERAMRRGGVAQGACGDPPCAGCALCCIDDDGRGNPEAAAAQRPGVSHHGV